MNPNFNLSGVYIPIDRRLEFSIKHLGNNQSNRIDDRAREEN